MLNHFDIKLWSGCGWLRRTSEMKWACWGLLFTLTVFNGLGATGNHPVPKPEEIWSLQPIHHPEPPWGATQSTNAIDAFIDKACKDAGLTPVGEADPLTWLRRVTLDLTGLAPTVEEQDQFLANPSATGRADAVNRLLASEQHGVRYGRHWLDVLRYSDLDENMPAAPGIHLWREWVINAINQDMPYDDFVRAQICGNRAAKRRTISPEGHLSTVEPRPEDLFALGFLARGATSRENADHHLAFSAVETISTAFLGMTVGCARCHDHFFDPIRQADFYSMKALFDPLVLRPVSLATPAQVFAFGGAREAYELEVQKVVDAMRKFIAPYHSKLYEERLSALPKEAQEAIRKPEKQRTAGEQKIADDYHPILRIDPIKIKEVMPANEIPQYEDYLKQLAKLKAPEPPPTFWTVEEDSRRLTEKSYVLTTGDPTRPKLSQPVEPGFPFATGKPEFRDGRRETFGDWLTAPENPLFARVVVNRIWQWHFGTGLHPSPGDFGGLGGKPNHPLLLDWLASEFIAHRYSMKWLHRAITTSETYLRASAGIPDQENANRKRDPDNRNLWKFPLRRLEAEPVRDALLQLAGTLDLSVGGKSFEFNPTKPDNHRRTAFMQRGYRSFQEVMPAFLQTFDAEDGRTVCTRRNQTETAPQALFLMNSPLVETASEALAGRLRKASHENLEELISLGYRLALGRPPTEFERVSARAYLGGEDDPFKSFAWTLMNLDEFVYVR
jgi:hypothetical protein